MMGLGRLTFGVRSKTSGVIVMTWWNILRHLVGGQGMSMDSRVSAFEMLEAVQ